MSHSNSSHNRTITHGVQINNISRSHFPHKESCTHSITEQPTTISLVGQVSQQDVWKCADCKQKAIELSKDNLQPLLYGLINTQTNSILAITEEKSDLVVKKTKPQTSRQNTTIKKGYTITDNQKEKFTPLDTETEYKVNKNTK